MGHYFLDIQYTGKMTLEIIQCRREKILSLASQLRSPKTIEFILVEFVSAFPKYLGEKRKNEDLRGKKERGKILHKNELKALKLHFSGL